MTKQKLGNIIGWICALLVAAFNLLAVWGKFVPPPPGSAAEEFGIKVGMTGLEYPLGVLEIIIVILFLIPRTSTVGFVLMVGYTGGIISAMLTHGFTFAETMPIYITLLVLTISGYFRNPELLTRLRKGSVSA